MVDGRLGALLSNRYCMSVWSCDDMNGEFTPDLDPKFCAGERAEGQEGLLQGQGVRQAYDA
jgi:hypothetical protein